MKCSQAEIDAEIAKAKACLLAGFGLDADDPANAGRLVFFSFMLDPRINYRACTAAGRKVPSQGRVVRDGGFGIRVIDPAGFEPGGEFAGQIAPPGDLAIFGNYNIEVTAPDGRPKDEIVISYRSDTPMSANAWGELVINCQISDNGFADGSNNGKAQGMGLPLGPSPGGSFEPNRRKLLTFSDNNGL